jgi:glycine/D-amino acid oxidase-like deaminating enzyme
MFTRELVGYCEKSGASACVVVTHSGVTLSPFLARAVAAEIVNDSREEQLEPFRPGRLLEADVLQAGFRS